MLTESYFAADTSSDVVELTIGQQLRDAAAEAPDAVALISGVANRDERASWTYAELLADAETAARALAKRFEKGERVALWAASIAEWMIMEYACALAGVVLVTINPAYQAAELKYVLEQSRSAGLFFTASHRANSMQSHLDAVRPDLPELRETVRFDDWSDFMASAPTDQALPDVTPDDPAMIQYTSGTTGFPKGAYLHHRGLVNNGRFIAERLGVGPASIYVNPMPLFHTGGCVCGVLSVAAARATIVNLETFDASLTLELIETTGATHLLAVTTMLIAMLEHADVAERDLSTLTMVCSGGSIVPAELVRRIEDTFGLFFSIIYGQTEASPGITLMRPSDTAEDKAMTLGPPLPQTELKVIDPGSGEIVATGVPGELCVRGYLVMLGYFEMPERTAEAIDADGWLHTGDLVSMDERGYTTITGRLKDMIISGGENIYPREIEELLFAHPKVAEVAICGLPDERWGETVGAFIRDSDPAAPATDAQLRDYLRQHLAPTRLPSGGIGSTAFGSPLQARSRSSRSSKRGRRASTTQSRSMLTRAWPLGPLTWSGGCVLGRVCVAERGFLPRELPRRKWRLCSWEGLGR